jgi:pimeloyl-ACP methyl ester carboxylesterase
VAAASVVAVIPSVRARGKAAAVLAEAVGAPFPRPFAPSVRRAEVALDGVRGALYVPTRPAPAVLLVLGAARGGPDDPRAVRLARALARAGRVVFAPRLSLAGRRFDEQDLDRIVRAALALEAHPVTVGRVAVLGISYGGSFALVAAADPRIRDRLAIVAVFGAYFDLVGVIQAATTGRSVVEGRVVPWDGHPEAVEILERHAVDLAPAPERDALAAVLAGRSDPSVLGPDARTVHDLLANRDPARTAGLAARLAPDIRARLARFSPATVAEAIDVPVVAMHSTDDPAVPYGEVLRLHVALPRARVVTVGSFRHVDLRSRGPAGGVAVAADLRDAWRFGSWLLEAQE